MIYSCLEMNVYENRDCGLARDGFSADYPTRAEKWLCAVLSRPGFSEAVGLLGRLVGGCVVSLNTRHKLPTSQSAEPAHH